MGLIVVDLTSPMSVGTWSGRWYVLIVIEASCQFGTGELLTTKDDMYGALVMIITWLEHQSQEKCHILHSDNGTEFVNILTRKFCEKNGITHHTTMPYTPEQNSIAEHTIAVYFKMVQCMLHSVQIDLQY